MKVFVNRASKTWSKNELPIVAWTCGDCVLGVLGKTANDDDARTSCAEIYFGDSAVERQIYLDMLRDVVDELIEANKSALQKEEEEERRKEDYKEELEATLAAQEQELQQLEAVKELRHRQAIELQAVKEQLKKKYGIEGEVPILQKSDDEECVKADDDFMRELIRHCNMNDHWASPGFSLDNTKTRN
jgi:hypothetical protein